RRREHFLDRSGGRALQAPRGRRRRRGGQARRQMGRDAVRLHRAQAGREGDAGGYHRLVPQEPRRLQMPALRRVRRTAADLDRETPELPAARHGKDGVTTARRAMAIVLAKAGTQLFLDFRFRGNERNFNAIFVGSSKQEVDAAGEFQLLARHSAAVCRKPRCRSERSIHSRVSFSCTPFWLSRARRLSKSTRSRSWSWLKQENTTLSTPLTGSRWTCRHCAQISFIMHCIGELMEASALCPGLRCGASIPCRAWEPAAIMPSEPMAITRSTSPSGIGASPSAPDP